MSVAGPRPGNHSAALLPARLHREHRTLAAMLRLHCGARHASQGDLCPACQALESYARLRLERCLFGVDKPTCAHCPVHCYRPAERAAVRDVMRRVGPRMLWRHPILTLRHWIDGWWHGTPSAPPAR